MEGIGALVCREQKAEACSTKSRNLTLSRALPSPSLSTNLSPASSHTYKTPPTPRQLLLLRTRAPILTRSHRTSGQIPGGSLSKAWWQRQACTDLGLPPSPKPFPRPSSPTQPALLVPGSSLPSSPLFSATSQPFPSLGGRTHKASLAWLAGFALPYRLPAQARSACSSHPHSCGERRKGGRRADGSETVDLLSARNSRETLSWCSRPSPTNALHGRSESPPSHTAPSLAEVLALAI